MSYQNIYAMDETVNSFLRRMPKLDFQTASKTQILNNKAGQIDRLFLIFE